ncbi:MAG TPA: hypothetical protein DCF45_00695 [Gammaproteobacteria bacterium]|nr:hypothetical protein [Gammaproteobacteria bacterium]
MPDQQQPDKAESPAEKLGFFSLLKEILWSFLGVRTHKGYEHAFQHARARDLILVGILTTVLFVLILIAIAYLAISYATR